MGWAAMRDRYLRGIQVPSRTSAVFSTFDMGGGRRGGEVSVLRYLLHISPLAPPVDLRQRIAFALI